MAVAGGYADKKTAAEVENLGPFVQKLRANMVKAIFKDKSEFDGIKKELEKIIKS